MFLSSPFSIDFNPKRIISLVPSQTELLAYLGLDDETIAITKFCIHPQEWFTTKERIGGTKNINIEKIKALKPDLIICNREENVKEQVEMLAEMFPVYISDVNSYDTALQMISDIGTITHKAARAEALISAINNSFRQNTFTGKKRIRTAYLIWKDPFMAAGGDTFTSDMMDKAGLENVYKNKRRYPQITVEGLRKISPELVLLSSEPYPFAQKHIEELQEYLPETKFLLADGELFSWYGSRMLQAPAYFQKIHSQSDSL